VRRKRRNKGIVFQQRIFGRIFSIQSNKKNKSKKFHYFKKKKLINFKILSFHKMDFKTEKENKKGKYPA